MGSCARIAGALLASGLTAEDFAIWPPAPLREHPDLAAIRLARRALPAIAARVPALLAAGIAVLRVADGRDGHTLDYRLRYAGPDARYGEVVLRD